MTTAIATAASRYHCRAAVSAVLALVVTFVVAGTARAELVVGAGAERQVSEILRAAPERAKTVLMPGSTGRTALTDLVARGNYERAALLRAVKNPRLGPHLSSVLPALVAVEGVPGAAAVLERLGTARSKKAVAADALFLRACAQRAPELTSIGVPGALRVAQLKGGRVLVLDRRGRKRSKRGIRALVNFARRAVRKAGGEVKAVEVLSTAGPSRGQQRYVRRQFRGRVSLARVSWPPPPPKAKEASKANNRLERVAATRKAPRRPRVGGTRFGRLVDAAMSKASARERKIQARRSKKLSLRRRGRARKKRSRRSRRKRAARRVGGRRR